MNEILLTGSVGFSWWDEECFTAKDVREMLAGLSGPLTVRLNSGGGIATEGQAIYTALKNYNGEVTIVIDGIAASAASLIAMAGDEIKMPLGSILMIHDPAQWGIEGRGTEEDHRKAADSLNVIANAYAAIYAVRAGISVEEAREVMRAETYFDGPAAVEAGFATEADSLGSAAPVAAFDYRLYSRAPRELQAVAAALPKKRSRAAVLAVMAGTSPQTSKSGANMPAKAAAKITRAKASKVTQVTASEEEDQTAQEEEELALDEEEILAEEEENLEEEETASEEGEEEEGEEEEEDPKEVNARRIIALCTARGVPAAQMARYITSGLTMKQVMNLHPQKGSGMTRARPPVARSQMIRDERATRRNAATEALAAQMTGARQVSAAARPYMQMSIVEIAASVTGQRADRARNWGQREDILMTASHATSDFPAIFQNALNKVLLERYGAFEPTYRAIARQKNFRDFRPMPLVRAGDFPTLLPVGEGGEIKWGTFGESGEQAVIVPYARGLTISRQMMINDELGAIADMMSDYGRTIAYFEERTFYAGALGAKMSDGKTIFHADHKNLATAGAAINRTSLSEGRAAMRKQQSIDKQSLNLSPSVLLVGPDKETEAEAIVAEITPTEVGNFNPFSGKLRPVVTAEITGNEWYLLSDMAPCWVYGFLEGREAPRVRTEEPFGKQGFSMTVEHDFGIGAADHRGGWKNPGA